jgi:hypothetical protein
MGVVNVVDMKQPVWVGYDQWSRSSKALPDQIKKAVVVALNRTIERMRAEANRRIRKGLALKSTYVRDHLYRLFASNSMSLPEARLVGSGRTLLTRYAHRQLFKKGKTVSKVRAGVNVTVRPGASKAMKGAFLLTLRGGNPGIATRRKGGGRGDIDVKHGPSVSQALAKHRKGLEQFGIETFRKQYQKALIFTIKR